MENEIIGEQPQEEITEQKIVEENSGLTESSSTRSLGKFKDTDSLLSAYNSLQAEFTKKCQKLSELEKAEVEPAVEPKIFDRIDWSEKVAEFIQQNSDAKAHAGEISQIIKSDDKLASSENALELAWAKVLAKHYKDPKNIIKDEEFVSSYILNDEEIKTKVLTEYLKNLEKNKSPMLVSGSSGNITLPKQRQATSLKEATEMVRKFFD